MAPNRTAKRRTRNTITVQEETRNINRAIALRSNQLNGGRRPKQRRSCPTNEHATTWGGRGHTDISSVWVKNDDHLGKFYSLVGAQDRLSFLSSLY